jgi:SAM-dependent methyltransferase
MAENLPHALFPRQTADERARHGFLVEFKRLLGARHREGIGRAWERDALPAFVAAQGRAPQDGREAAAALRNNDYFRLWTALARAQHALYVDSTAACVERQAATLVDACRELARSARRGSLHLDPALPVPPYQAALDVHCVPGGYCLELGDDDVYAGARYELGISLFSLGHHGSMNDSKGLAGVRFLQQRFPQFAPRRILELGCTAGNSLLPYCDAWPQAEVHGIDVSAPCLRYAHARTEVLGRAVHYAQDDAEGTRFPDAHFDLVVSHILLHELSADALPRVFAECRRLLRPGGLMLHIEVPVRNARLDVLGQALADWDSDYNNEPFWGGLHATDLAQVARAAGFADADIFDEDLDPALTAFINRQPWMAFGARLGSAPP